MLRLGQNVRLDASEKNAIEAFVGETIAPKTVEDVHAWLQAAVASADMATPEERLMAAVFGDMALELA